ncbi:MAG TPA: LysR family transcriptional regulator [Pedococcus sp.]|nr:LysR family transcriptional regulator [Pedococcus sp.]
MSARDLSLRHLLALLAVHDEGSYRRAAAATGYSQAAITQQIAALENAVGAPVFDRHPGPRPVTLTQVGREVVEAARVLVARADLLDARVTEVREGRWGRLAIGTFQSVSATLLPVVLAQVRAEEPDVDISVVQSEDNVVLADSVASGALDVCFLVGPFKDDRLSIREVCRDPFVAIEAADKPARDVLPIAELAGLPLIGHQDCVCHDMVELGFRTAGITATYVFRSNDNSAVQAMVRAGIGTAVMPLLAIDSHDPLVRVIPLQPPLPQRRILIAVPRTRAAPTAQRFVQRAVMAGKDLPTVRRPPATSAVRAR